MCSRQRQKPFDEVWSTLGEEDGAAAERWRESSPKAATDGENRWWFVTAADFGLRAVVNGEFQAFDLLIELVWQRLYKNG